MERSNYWNAEFLLFNSRNEWIFEIYNHFNRSNGQLLLSFIFSCHNVSLVLPTSSHGALCSRESSIHLEWVESAVTFRIHFSSVSQSKRLNSLDGWPTVVLLLSMLHITMATVNLSVDQGHDSQMAVISSIAAKDIQPWEFPQRKLWEISLFCGVDIVTNWSISLFSVAVQLLSKPL